MKLLKHVELFPRNQNIYRIAPTLCPPHNILNFQILRDEIFTWLLEDFKGFLTNVWNLDESVLRISSSSQKVMDLLLDLKNSWPPDRDRE